MADPLVDSSKASSTFPDPPPFWQDFMPERIARFESLKQQHADRNGLDATAVVRVPNVPEDLICLQPPAEPADGKWRLFGEAQSVSLAPVSSSTYFSLSPLCDAMLTPLVIARR